MARLTSSVVTADASCSEEIGQSVSSDSEEMESGEVDGSPSSSSKQFVTAVQHQNLYPNLDHSHSSDSNHVHRPDQTAKVGVVGRVNSEKAQTDDFVTAQCTSPQLLQLLTTQPVLEGDKLKDLSESPLVRDQHVSQGLLETHKRGVAQEFKRPSSMSFRGHGARSISQRSPLATSASRAPHRPLIPDHTHATDEATPLKLTTIRLKKEKDVPLSSKGEFNNSYSILGKRKEKSLQITPSVKKPRITPTNRSGIVKGASMKSQSGSSHPVDTSVSIGNLLAGGAGHFKESSAALANPTMEISSPNKPLTWLQQLAAKISTRK